MRGHIRRRGENSWELRWYVGRGPDGKKRYRTKTVRSSRKSDAQKELNRILGEMAKGEYVEPARMTLTEYSEEWLNGVKGSLKFRTWEWYEMIMRVHVLPVLGHYRLSELSPKHVQNAYTDLLRQGASPSTINGCHRVLRSALNKAVEWEYLSRNPVQGAEPPRKRQVEKQVLSPEQASKLLEVSRPTGRYSLYLAAVTTGMRQGELLALRWSDVDFDKNLLYVSGTLSRKRERDTPKTQRSVRPISVPQELIEELRELPQISEYVWCTEEGRPLNHRNLGRQFKNLLRKAGLPDIRFHDLRHTHATLLLEAGEHPKVVQERLGHTSISITMDTYSHVRAPMRDATADRISSILGLSKNTENASPLAGTLEKE